MSWGEFGWRPYVPVAVRRARAAKEVARLAKTTGKASSPVVLEGRKIASTFWGKAWCDNLEAYSDFANRLPRGRTYVRNGSVVDLQIEKGNVRALVSGSELYRIQIKIKPLLPAHWKSIQNECAGKIDSLLELLQGKLSSAVMQIVTRQNGGLFPSPKEIDLDCSCPDWADLCKHVAASLYGVAAHLDRNPGLLFLLRGVDPTDLISQASAAEAIRQTDAESAALNESEMAEVFGIELATGPAPAMTPAASAALEPASPAQVPDVSRTPLIKRRAGRKRPANARKLSAVARARLAAVAKARWQQRKAKSVTPKAARAPTRNTKSKTGPLPEAAVPPGSAANALPLPTPLPVAEAIAPPAP